MDAVGWGLLLLVLLLGIPYTRYFLREWAIPNWPTATARITSVEARHHRPREPKGPLLWAQYVYVVDDTSYSGWFALPAKDLATAEEYVKKLEGQTLAVKYDPHKPKDSVVGASLVLGQVPIQENSFLNPKVW